MRDNWISTQNSAVNSPELAAPSQVQNVIDRLFRDGTVVSRMDGKSRDLFPIAIPELEGHSLRNWVQREGAGRTIEVGLAFAMSTLFICQGLLENGKPERRHVVLDPNQETWYANSGIQALQDAGVMGMVEFHAKESRLLLPEFLADGHRFDLAFVDGNHRFEFVFLDLIYLASLVRGNGIIFVDDYQLPAVARAVSFCSNNLGWTTEELSPHDDHHQWAVLRTPLVPLERKFDDYVDF